MVESENTMKNSFNSRKSHREKNPFSHDRVISHNNLINKNKRANTSTNNNQIHFSG